MRKVEAKSDLYGNEYGFVVYLFNQKCRSTPKNRLQLNFCINSEEPLDLKSAADTFEVFVRDFCSDTKEILFKIAFSTEDCVPTGEESTETFFLTKGRVLDNDFDEYLEDAKRLLGTSEQLFTRKKEEEEDFFDNADSKIDNLFEELCGNE